MKRNSILDGIRESFYIHGRKTEHIVFAMLMGKMLKDTATNKKVDEFTIKDIANLFEEASTKSSCINFAEGELVLQDNYELHSVSACRDEDGDPEVYIHMYEIESGETHSVRVHQFPQMDWLLQIIEVVTNKCELTFNTDEDEED